MVWFLPWELGKERKGHVASQQWISASSHGGAYSPTAVLDKLMERLQAKIKHYGGLSRPVRLLVHYGKAVVYNTPWYGPSCRTFCDVAEAAAGTVANQSCFQMIYLLNAIEPGLEAYEIFPALMKCE
jgi:cytolysin (calcineurin-like family phosphatase)